MKLPGLTPVVSSNASESVMPEADQPWAENPPKHYPPSFKELRRVIRIYLRNYICGLLQRRIKKETVVWDKFGFVPPIREVYPQTTVSCPDNGPFWHFTH